MQGMVRVMSVVTVLGCAALSSAQLRYSVKDIGAVPGFSASKGLRIGRTGFVAGCSDWPYRAFVWTAQTGVIDLGASAGNPPGDINATGLTVGGYTGTYPFTGWYWKPGMGVQSLPGSGSYQDTHGIGCNDDGVMVGYAAGLFANQHAFKWKPDGTPVDLGTLPGTTTSTATDVDESGTVVGYATGTVTTAFQVQDGGQMTALAPLAGYDCSQALRIADDGAVLGYFFRSSGGIGVYGVWRNGQPVPLEGLRTGTLVLGSDVAGPGWAVGSESARDHAWAWVRDPEGRLYALQDRMDAATSDTWLELSSAFGVNAQGWVTGMGRRLVNGMVVERAFVARPLKTPAARPPKN